VYVKSSKAIGFAKVNKEKEGGEMSELRREMAELS
jgi:hypothetical protein